MKPKEQPIKKDEVKRVKKTDKPERTHKHERLISHYFFSGAHQNDTFIENCF